MNPTIKTWCSVQIYNRRYLRGDLKFDIESFNERVLVLTGCYVHKKGKFSSEDIYDTNSSTNIEVIARSFSIKQFRDIYVDLFITPESVSDSMFEHLTKYYSHEIYYPRLLEILNRD